MQQQPVAGPNDFHIEIGPDGVEHLVSGLGFADPPERGPIMGKAIAETTTAFTNKGMQTWARNLKAKEQEIEAERESLRAAKRKLDEKAKALAAREKATAAP